MSHTQKLWEVMGDTGDADRCCYNRTISPENPYVEALTPSVTVFKDGPLKTYIRLSARAQTCPTLWDPTDCSPPGSSVHRIFPVRILEWVAFLSSRGSSRPTEGRFFTAEPPGIIIMGKCGALIRENWCRCEQRKGHQG